MWWGKNRFAHKRASIYRCDPFFWRFIAGQIPALSIFRIRSTIPVDSAAVAGETPNRSAASRQTNYGATDMNNTARLINALIALKTTRNAYLIQLAERTVLSPDDNVCDAYKAASAEYESARAACKLGKYDPDSKAVGKGAYRRIMGKA